VRLQLFECGKLESGMCCEVAALIFFFFFFQN
jgi:hypothetical protein